MLKDTNCGGFQKSSPTDINTQAFLSRIPQRAEPGGISLQPGSSGGLAQNVVLACFYGATADNGTFSVRFIGWRRIGSDESTWLWIPVILCQLACIAGQTIGVQGSNIGPGEAFADTITLTIGTNGVNADVVSPGNNTIAHAVIDLKGSQKLELSFRSDFGTAEANGLIAMY